MFTPGNMSGTTDAPRLPTRHESMDFDAARRARSSRERGAKVGRLHGPALENLGQRQRIEIYGRPFQTRDVETTERADEPVWVSGKVKRIRKKGIEKSRHADGTAERVERDQAKVDILQLAPHSTSRKIVSGFCPKLLV
jgi:hypothetical protein